jgi:hypothetical protein
VVLVAAGLTAGERGSVMRFAGKVRP